MPAGVKRRVAFLHPRAAVHRRTDGREAEVLPRRAGLAQGERHGVGTGLQLSAPQGPGGKDAGTQMWSIMVCGKKIRH